MRNNQRICIIGPSSTGKSTLAHRLGQILSYPVYHLDIFHHIPGTWQARPHDEYLGLHDAAVAEDYWIIEGNYTRSMPQRFARADMIIHMEMGRWGCLGRYLKRCFTTRWGLAPRYGASANATNEFNWAMVKWIMVPHKVDAKWTEKQSLFDGLLNDHAHKIITIRSFNEMDILIKDIEKSNTKEHA